MSKTGRQRFSIGIDLGTSNCALAYVDLREKDAPSRILEIPQWDTAERSVTLAVLPSFAYYPRGGMPGATAVESAGTAPVDPKGRQVVGLLARNVSVQEPGRVAFSAKSWLTHAGVDRQARILPWASKEIPDPEKLSPVEASALYLEYLRAVWNLAMAGEDERCHFDRQHIVITVPASFDQGAQKLTLEAAR
nr:molecular chaperone DnaK [Fibrobacterota bacterium]